MITTDCGHEFPRPVNWPSFSIGGTLDCPMCGTLLILALKDDKEHARNFHEYMNERNPQWPVDGAGTGYVEF